LLLQPQPIKRPQERDGLPLHASDVVAPKAKRRPCNRCQRQRPFPWPWLAFSTAVRLDNAALAQSPKQLAPPKKSACRERPGDNPFRPHPADASRCPLFLLESLPSFLSFHRQPRQAKRNPRWPANHGAAPSCPSIHLHSTLAKPCTTRPSGRLLVECRVACLLPIYIVQL